MPPVHHRKKDAGTIANERTHRVIFIIRQVLNILFIILAVIGGLMYSGLLGSDDNTVMNGAIIAIIAVVMKMGECVLRYINKLN